MPTRKSFLKATTARPHFEFHSVELDGWAKAHRREMRRKWEMEQKELHKEWLAMSRWNLFYAITRLDKGDSTWRELFLNAFGILDDEQAT